MKKKRVFLLLIIWANMNLTACGPSQTAQGDQATQEAVAPAATRTQVYLDNLASKPTTTLTAKITPTPTQTPLPTPLPPPAYGPIDTRVSETDGMELVYVPAGEFLMGFSDENLDYIYENIRSGDDRWMFEDMQPQHTVYLDAYWIDRTEVTNAMFATFLSEEGNQIEEGADWYWGGIYENEDFYIEQLGSEWHPVSGFEDHPVGNVTWYGARAYCQWAGRRLPTEAEWEKAARGDDGRLFPWGNDTLERACSESNCDEYKGIKPVGSFPEWASPYGVLDMAGNVNEWVADFYDGDYYAESPTDNPTGPTTPQSSNSDMRVIRGGAGGTLFASINQMTAYRDYQAQWSTYEYFGFRCTTSSSTDIPIERPLKFTEIHMVNEMDGWGFYYGSVWITRDGGRTWREVTPPETSTEEKRYDAFGTFLDANYAWVIFGTGLTSPDSAGIDTHTSVWYTADGGETWNVSQPIGVDTLIAGNDCSITFSMVDVHTGWLQITGYYLAAGQKTPTNLFRTMDGGATWSRLDWCGDSVDDNCFSTPQWLDPTDMAFVDHQTGWFLERTLCPGCQGGEPKYYTTSDSGVTWNVDSAPAPINNPDLFSQHDYCDPYQLNLLSEEVVRFKVACINWGGRKEPADYVYATEDGGLTWDAHKLPVASGGNGDRLIFFNANYGLLLGREMWRTEDGGRTWQHINTVTWDGQFSFIDRWRGWAIAESEGGENALVYTTNGGETWKMLNPVEVE